MALRERCAGRGREGETARGEQDGGTETDTGRETGREREREVDKERQEDTVTDGHLRTVPAQPRVCTHVHTVTHAPSHPQLQAHSHTQ